MFAKMKMVVTMKIIKMKKVSKGKYQLFLANGAKITTYDDVILKYDFLLKKEVTNDQLIIIHQQTKYYDIYYKAIKYITTKLRSQYELEQYLQKNQVLEEEKQRLMEELKQKGILNDLLFARAYTSDKKNLSRWGLAKIKTGLKEHHIALDIIEEVLSKVEEEDVIENLDHIIQKKIANNRKYSSYQLKEKIVMDLIQKGYEKDQIETCLSQYSLAKNGILKKEYQRILKRLEKKYEGSALAYQVKSKLYQKGFSKEELKELEDIDGINL